MQELGARIPRSRSGSTRRRCAATTTRTAASGRPSRTPVSSLITGGLVLATLLVLAPLFAELPKAVLGAVIIDAVVFGMIDIAELRRLYRVTRVDFWVAVAAIVGVLSVGVLAGVVVGVVLSLGWLVYVATRPPLPLLGRQAGTQVFRDLDENPAAASRTTPPAERESTDLPAVITDHLRSSTADSVCAALGLRGAFDWSCVRGASPTARSARPGSCSTSRSTSSTPRARQVIDRSDDAHQRRRRHAAPTPAASLHRLLAVLEADGDHRRHRPAATSYVAT